MSVENDAYSILRENNLIDPWRIDSRNAIVKVSKDRQLTDADTAEVHARQLFHTECGGDWYSLADDEKDMWRIKYAERHNVDSETLKIAVERMRRGIENRLMDHADQYEEYRQKLVLESRMIDELKRRLRALP